MSVSGTQQELARALELGWRFWLIKVVVTVFVYGQEEDAVFQEDCLHSSDKETKNT
jgi:hypothetical protein